MLFEVSIGREVAGSCDWPGSGLCLTIERYKVEDREVIECFEIGNKSKTMFLFMLQTE